MENNLILQSNICDPVFHAGKEGIQVDSNFSKTMLKDVQPEDIEDVTERYVYMFAEERNSDIVKRVRIQGEDSDGDKIPGFHRTDKGGEIY